MNGAIEFLRAICSGCVTACQGIIGSVSSFS